LSLVVQYNGRVCLLGEHCDWAGGASLTLPTPLGVRLAIEDGPRSQRETRVRTAVHGQLFETHFPPVGRVEPDGGIMRFAPACAWALSQRGIRLRPATLWVHASLPAARGFSSSAAFCLATLDALSRHAGEPLEAEVLAELAWHVERELLGVPCGRLDQLACVAGAPAFFRWDPQGRAPIRRLEPRVPLHLVIAVFPRARDTTRILNTLRRLRFDDLRRPEEPEGAKAVHEALGVFASTAEAGAHALEVGDRIGLGLAMAQAQAAYEAMARVVPELAAPGLVRAAKGLMEEVGLLGAKFSGAGGDGSVIGLCADADQLGPAQKLLVEQGLPAWPLTLEAL